MAVTVHGLRPREGDTVFAFMVVRLREPRDRDAVVTLLRAIAELIPDAETFIDEWSDELEDKVRIIGMPWTPPDNGDSAGNQRRVIDSAELHGVETVWFLQTGTSLPLDDDELDADIDDDDDAELDDADDAGITWSHGPPPQVTSTRFPVDGYPGIIAEHDWEDFGIAVKLRGDALPGMSTVLFGFHSLWLAPYGGRFRNTAVTYDRTHNAAHFWVDRFATPTDAAEQVHHLLWMITKLDEVVPIVRARFAEASMTQKYGGMMGETREPFVLGGNPLLAAYSLAGEAGVDAWIAEQTDWSKHEVAAMLREVAIEIVTQGASDVEATAGDDIDDESDEITGEHDEVTGEHAIGMVDDEDDDQGRQITGYAGDILRARAAAGKLNPRAAERLLPVLDTPERYEQRRHAVVDIFAALRYRSAVPVMIKILETTTIKNSLDSIGKEDLIAATAAALGAIGDPAAIPALAKVVAAPGTHNDTPRPVAADALASCLQATPEPRHVDDSALAELLTTISERNDGELNAETHFAYGRLVRQLPAERRAEARRKLADADTARDDAIAMLARQAALLLASPTTPIDPPPRDLQPLLRESLTTLDYDHEYTVRNLRVALRVADIVPDLVEPDDIVWLTRFAEADIRRSAHALLAKLGKPLPEAPTFDRTSVRSLDDGELVRAIGEPHVVGRAALIGEAGRRRLAAAKSAIIAACQDVVARARQGGENLLDPDARVLEAAVPYLRELPLDVDVVALFDRMLRHSNVHVKWELVEDAPRDERLLGGMFYVLAEKWGWQEDAAKVWVAHFRGTPAYETERRRMSAPVAEPDAQPAAAPAATAHADDEDIN